MQHVNTKRLLSTMLCAAMLAQPLLTTAGAARWDRWDWRSSQTYSEPAEEPAALSETNDSVSLRSGTAVIPASSSLEEVKEILAEALIDDPDIDALRLNWEYYCQNTQTTWGKTTPIDKKWGPIEGSSTSKTLLGVETTYTHPALADNADDDYQVRLAGDKGNVVTLTKKSVLDSSIELLKGVSVAIPYTDNGSIDFDALREALFDAVVVSTTPEGLTVKNVTVEYYATKSAGLVPENAYVPLEGKEATGTSWGTYPPISAGEQTIRFTYDGDGTYSKRLVETAVTLTEREALDIIKPNNAPVGLTYKEDLSVDYEKLKQDIRATFTASVENVDLSGAKLTYYATAKSGSVGDLGKNWAPIAGGKVSGLDYPTMGEGTHAVKLEWDGNSQYQGFSVEGTVVVSDRASAPYTLRDPIGSVKLPLNADTSVDYESLKGLLFDAIVDSSDVLTAENVTMTYYATAVTGSVGSLGEAWMPLEGGTKELLTYPGIPAGEKKVRLYWPGNQKYVPTTIEATVTITDREQVQFNLKDVPYEVGMQFNAEQSYDYEKTAKAIYDAVVASTTPAIDYSNVKIEYTTTIDLAGVNFQPLNYQGDTGLLDFKDGTWRIRISCGESLDYRGNSVTVTVTTTDNRPAGVVALKEGASFTYSMDSAAMERAIFENVIDWENSTLPAGVDISSFEILYKAQMDVLDDSVDADKLGGLISQIPGLGNIGGSIGDIAGGLSDSTKRFMPIAGGSYLGIPYAPMGAGEHQVQVTFKGSADYKPSDAAEGTVTVNKANVKVKVHSDNIRADEPLPEGFITTDPADKFEFYTIYAGATSNVSLGLYLDLPDKYDNNKLIKIIDPVVGKIAGRSFSKMLQDGVTLGELRALLVNTEFIDLLEKLGVDTGAFGQIIKVVSALPSITDGVRIGFGIPGRAGLYTVTVITDNKNYNTGVGVGALLVRMHLSGVKLTWNQELGSKISAADAKTFDFGATLSKDGDPTIDQSSVHYLYSGFTSKWRPYSSTIKAPTEPGRYSMTVVTLGGNYQAAPITRTFQITK